MTVWIGPCNPSYYDVRGALAKFKNVVDWTKRINVEIGDIYYLYESQTSKRIIAKFEVIDNNVTAKNRLLDDEFWSGEVKISSSGYFRMKLIEMLDEGLNREWLKNNGLKSNIQSAERVNQVLLKNISEWEQKIEKFDDDSSFDLTSTVVGEEGQKIEYYTYRYERNPLLRHQAILIHGTACTCCGFDFKKIYGPLGNDFIEIHHVKPISSFDSTQIVNPKTDLIPLCSNCHRMIHRKKDRIISIRELQDIIKMQIN